MDTDVHKYSDYIDDDNDDDSVQVGLEYDITLSSLLAIMIKYRASLLIIVREQRASVGWSCLAHYWDSTLKHQQFCRKTSALDRQKIIGKRSPH